MAFLAIPTQPSDDDFYDAPPNIDLYNVGEVMKWRSAPQKVSSLLHPINIQDASQFMVRSTNTQGKPVGIVGTLLQPYNADPKKILVYNYFQDSVSVNCAPSYSILFGADSETISSQLESVYMNAALTKGWYVLIPDYEGPNAAFAAGKLAGMATLDAIRAALKSGINKKTAIDPNAQVAIWGYSGGTIPSIWAGTLQPSYAPELSKNLIGVAAGGTVANISHVLDSLDGTTYAGFVGAGILGLSSEYPSLQAQIFDHMDPNQVGKLKGLYNKCLIGSIVSLANANFFKGNSPVFPEKKALLARDDVSQMINENTLAFNPSSPKPAVPVFLYHGKPDQIIPFQDVQNVYDTWCSQGIQSLEFAVSQTSGHLNEWLEGGGAALQWLSKRFSGDAPVSGCSRTERKSNLEYPGAQQSFSAISRTTILSAFSARLSPLLVTTLPDDFISTSIYNVMTWLLTSLRWFPFK